MSSVASDKIVPFGQDFVLDDMSVTLTFKEWVAFCLCLIDSSVDGCEYSESRLSPCSGCQFACLLILVLALDASSLASSMVLNTAPLQTLEICEKSLCSMGFHLEQ